MQNKATDLGLRCLPNRGTSIQSEIEMKLQTLHPKVEKMTSQIVKDGKFFSANM